MRDRLQKGIYSIIDPVVRGLVKVGVTPNFERIGEPASVSEPASNKTEQSK